MKAYLAGIRDDDDAGQELVFADTAQKARSKVWGTDFTAFAERYIDVYAHRAKKWDYLEGKDQRECYKEFWRDGWWFHQSGYPDSDEATDEDFYKWYDETFGVKA